MIATTPATILNCATELVFSDIFTKFPNLKIALSEGGIGWIPYLLERMDYVHAHHHAWTHHEFPGSEKPSDVFREHVICCFIDDAIGVKNRDAIGIDNITWECDYPPSDSTWPHAPEILWRSLTGLSDGGDRQDHLAERGPGTSPTTRSSTSRRRSARSARCADRLRTST